MHKYVGTYRVKTEIDQRTNDFCRNDKGELENNQDIYIKCAKGIRIYHYGGSTLLAYIPSKGRGRNIIKNESIKDLIFNIEETDSEVLFKFKDKHMEEIASVLQPQVSGASMSPFSSKNLPKKKSVLTNAQIEEYKKIISVVPQDDKLKVSHINNRFLNEILCKKHHISTQYAKAEMKKELLKLLDYISFKGMWNEYINYLGKEVGKLYEETEN